MRARTTSALGAAMTMMAATLGMTEPAIAGTPLRGMQPASRRLIADGTARSPTIRKLVRRLEASDLIVFVDVRRDMAAHIVGTTQFMARTPSHRLVRIAMNLTYKWPTLVAFLGHELQHACEIADQPAIDSGAAMQAYYREFGVRIDRNAFDTHEAQEVGRLVERELREGTTEVAQGALLQARTT